MKNNFNWNVSLTDAKNIQNKLAHRVIKKNQFNNINIIAGIDISYIAENIGVICIVLIKFPELDIIDYLIRENNINFPYRPGFLSFREAPAIINAINNLKISPDLFMFDGQGIAHPRKLGIAAHVGVLLNKTSIGVAKSRLYGTYNIPKRKKGDYSYLYDKDKNIIGAVLRTRDNINPVYVSIGNKIDLHTSIKYVLKCCPKYKLPEPTRQAHNISRKYIQNK